MRGIAKSPKQLVIHNHCMLIHNLWHYMYIGQGGCTYCQSIGIFLAAAGTAGQEVAHTCPAVASWLDDLHCSRWSEIVAKDVYPTALYVKWESVTFIFSVELFSSLEFPSGGFIPSRAQKCFCGHPINWGQYLNWTTYMESDNWNIKGFTIREQ